MNREQLERLVSAQDAQLQERDEEIEALKQIVRKHGLVVSAVEPSSEAVLSNLEKLVSIKRQQWDGHTLIDLGNNTKLYVINRPDEDGHVVVKKDGRIVTVIRPESTSSICLDHPTEEQTNVINVGIGEEFDD